jgi:hypothetical protein
MKAPLARVRDLQEQRIDIRNTADLLLKKLREANANPDWSDYLRLDIAKTAVIVVNFKEDFVQDSIEFINKFKEELLGEGESDTQAS